MEEHSDNIQEVLDKEPQGFDEKTSETATADHLESSHQGDEAVAKADTAELKDEDEHDFLEFEDINDERVVESDEHNTSRPQSVNSETFDNSFASAKHGVTSLHVSEGSSNKDVVANSELSHEIDKDKPEQLLERPQDTVQSDFVGDVNIQTITVTEDDDLFDFSNIKPVSVDLDNKDSKDSGIVRTEQGDFYYNSEGRLISVLDDADSLEEGEIGRDLQKYELYKYLTSQNIQDIKSSEVTPQHSDQVTPQHSDHDSDEESDSSSESEETSDSEAYTSASSEEEVHEDISDTQSYYTKQPETEDIEGELSEDNIKDKVKATPVATKRFRPRMTKKMKSILAKSVERIKKSKEVTDRWLKELELPKNLDLSNPVNLNITELNKYLTCGLCSGYLYEASTVTECMHTFCKNCIVRHCMEVSLNCPVCNILIHPTDPFVNIRLDRMIQDIVYKLLPNVAEAEMKNMTEFYDAHPEVEPREMTYYPIKPKISPEKTEALKASAALVSLVLEAENEMNIKKDRLEKKFVRVKGSATIANLCHFLKKKLSLEESKAIDIFCCGDIIEENTSTLQNIKEKFYSNDEDCLMLLQFKVAES